MLERGHLLRVWFALAAFALGATGQEPDPGALARKAGGLMKGGQFAEAERIYQSLADRFPEESGLVLNLGLAQFSSRRYEEAIGQFERFLEASPGHGPAWLLVGLSYQRLGRPDEAVGPLERAVVLVPENATARLELADALLRSGRFSRSASEFLRLAERDRSNPQAWLGLGLSYVQLSRIAARQLEDSAPGSAFHSLLLGRSAQARRQYRAAYWHFRAALEIDPDAPGANAAIAEIYARIGKSDWSEVELSKASRSVPCERRQLECWFEAGDMDSILAASERQDGAEPLYWRALALAEKAREAHGQLLSLPPSATAYALLASIEDLAGRPVDAAGAWKRAIDLEPANRDYRRSLLRSLNAAGLHKQLLDESDALVRTHPESVAGYFHSGDALLQLGRVEESIPPLEAALRMESGDRRIQVSLATALLRLGRGAEAIPHLEAALRGGSDERLLFQLSRAYQMAGRAQDARSALERRKRMVTAAAPAAPAREITPP